MKTQKFSFFANIALVCFYASLSPSAYAQSGSLDTTFGGTGAVLVNTDGNVPSTYDLDQARGVAIQSDGKIVAAGISSPNRVQQFAVLRVDAFGNLDPTFGNGGIATLGIGTGNSVGYAVAIDAFGNIVVAGNTTVSSSQAFAVARFTSTGVLDPSFGSGGVTSFNFGNTKQGTDDEARSVAIQADGKILVGGFSSGNGALARLNADGSLDVTFGNAGKVTNVLGGYGAVAVQSDGKIVFGGTSPGSRKTGSDFGVIRYNANGTVDSSFGVGGTAAADFFGLDDRLRAVAIDAGGNIVAVGSATSSTARKTTQKNFALARFTPSGQLDTSFGTGGKTTAFFSTYLNDWLSVAIQANGQIVSAGYYYDAGGNGSFVVVRNNANGALDTAFGNGGAFITRFGGNPDNYAYGVGIQTDGKIVAVGTGTTADPSVGDVFALVRLNP